MNKELEDRDRGIRVKESILVELQHRKADWKSKSYSGTIKRMLQETEDDVIINYPMISNRLKVRMKLLEKLLDSPKFDFMSDKITDNFGVYTLWFDDDCFRVGSSFARRGSSSPKWKGIQGRINIHKRFLSDLYQKSLKYPKIQKILQITKKQVDDLLKLGRKQSSIKQNDDIFLKVQEKLIKIFSKHAYWKVLEMPNSSWKEVIKVESFCKGTLLPISN